MTSMGVKEGGGVEKDPTSHTHTHTKGMFGQ